MVRLKEPEYTDECWDTTRACAYRDATISIAVYRDIPDRAPEVVEMLRAWNLDLELYKDVGKWRLENRDASINETALWWLKSNVSVWSGWVTPEAAEAIKAALEANEIPDGWPSV